MLRMKRMLRELRVVAAVVAAAMMAKMMGKKRALTMKLAP
jgi:hypothetical protein